MKPKPTRIPINTPFAGEVKSGDKAAKVGPDSRFQCALCGKSSPVAFNCCGKPAVPTGISYLKDKSQRYKCSVCKAVFDDMTICCGKRTEKD